MLTMVNAFAREMPWKTHSKSAGDLCARMLLAAPFMLSALSFSLPQRGLPTTRAICTIRSVPMTMGLFDGFKKAFENKDYSQSPGTYEQTNARASHVLVATEEEAQKIKDQIDAGEIDFAEAAVQYSSCSSASRGGA